MGDETTKPGEITILLRRVRAGQAPAMDELFRVVYDDLRSMARSALNSGGFGYLGLDGTGVVHAACARLLGRDQLDAEDRRHFFFLLSRAMKDVIVEEARAALADKRGGKHRRVELLDTMDGKAETGASTRWDVMDLDVALAELQAADPESAQVVQLRFFAGRTLEQTAELMGTSVAIVRGHWSYAKSWLGERLAPASRSRTLHPEAD
ncbi:MAG: RNA polymerase subunit sigma [Pyrinomonadaceae bacterium]|nr:RNA polymerase subunit sigma [Phycisphaerales bacterium]